MHRGQLCREYWMCAPTNHLQRRQSKSEDIIQFTFTGLHGRHLRSHGWLPIPSSLLCGWQPMHHRHLGPQCTRMLQPHPIASVSVKIATLYLGCAIPIAILQMEYAKERVLLLAASTQSIPAIPPPNNVKSLSMILSVMMAIHAHMITAV